MKLKQNDMSQPKEPHIALLQQIRLVLSNFQTKNLCTMLGLTAGFKLAVDGKGNPSRSAGQPTAQSNSLLFHSKLAHYPLQKLNHESKAFSIKPTQHVLQIGPPHSFKTRN